MINSLIISASLLPDEYDADIIFALDASITVSKDDFLVQKSFVKSMAKYLNVVSDKSRAAVISYGDSSTSVVRFGSYSSLHSLEDAIDKAPYIGGTRRIDKALENVGVLLGEARPAVPKVVVLLTAGRQSTDPRAKSLVEASKPLRDQGAKTFIFAIGSESDVNELEPIVDRTGKIFELYSFESLSPRSRSMAAAVAKQAGELNTMR